MWVSGSELHYLDPDGSDYAETGTAIGTPAGAIPGSIWDDAGGVIRYIDASGVQRQVSATFQGPAAPGAANGSIYVEPASPQGLRVRWISSGTFDWWNGS